MDTQYVNLLFQSSDPQSVGNSSTYTARLPVNLSLEGSWKACLLSCSFTTAAFGATPRSHYVFLSLVEPQPVGSQLRRLLFRTNQLPQSTTSDVTLQSTVVPWRTLDPADRTVDAVEVTIVDSTGAAIDTASPSTLEVILRRVA